MSNMEYSAEHRAPPRPRADAARMSPLRAAFCVQQLDYDDGNGMYVANADICLIHGVSPCGQENSVVTIPCP